MPNERRAALHKVIPHRKVNGTSAVYQGLSPTRPTRHPVLDFIFLSLAAGHKNRLHLLAHSPLTCHPHTPVYVDRKRSLKSGLPLRQMSSAITPAVQFSCIRATGALKYPKLRVQVTLDGKVQESQESTLDRDLHEWHEPFFFHANSNSQCEIHLLAKGKNFFCWTGSYKPVRKTRPYSVGDLLNASSNGVVKLPLFDPKTDKTGDKMGNVIFMITNTRSNTRDDNSVRVSGTASPIRMVSSEKEPSMEGRASPPPSYALTPALLRSPSDSRHPSPHVPPHSPTRVSRDVLAPHTISPSLLTLESHSQLPQVTAASSPNKSGVDQLPTEIQALRHLSGRINDAVFPESSAMGPSVTATREDSGPCRSPVSPSFISILCEPPQDLVPGIAVTPCLVEEPQPTEFLAPTVSGDAEPATFSQINIIISSSSRSGSPLSASGESDGINKKPSSVSGFLHVNTGTTGQGPHANTSGQLGEPSPTTSLHPATSTTHNSGVSRLSPFSRDSFLDSPSTAATSPSLHSVDLPSSPGRPHRQRPKIDTSCVGPRGQVRKYTVPPVNPPTKLRNGSLDLPRHDQYEKFEHNHSTYSIAPSVSSRNFKSGTERCSSTQRPASRQDYAASPRAPSVRREQLEYDDTQICLDTANLGEQEVAAFLREVDAALSAITNRSAAAASDGPAFLSVPNTGRISSRQSRRPSCQQLRADVSAPTRVQGDWAGAVRTTWAPANHSSHPDGTPSRLPSPLSSLIPRNLSFSPDVPQIKFPSPDIDVNPGAGPLISVEDTAEKGAIRVISGSRTDGQLQGKVRVPFYPASQGPSPQPSSRWEIAV